MMYTFEILKKTTRSKAEQDKVWILSHLINEEVFRDRIILARISDTYLFKEGLLAVFPLLSVAPLVKDGGFAEDTCSGLCRQRTPSGRITGLFN